MNRVLAAMTSGAVGAISLTLLHEFAKRTAQHPPRLDVLGMKAIAQGARSAHLEPPRHLHATALAGDLAANSAYYALAGAAGPQNAVALGTALGAAAGIGALALPAPLGLGGAETNRTPGTQAMAAGLYIAAGIVAGLTFRALSQEGDLEYEEDEDGPAWPEVWY